MRRVNYKKIALSKRFIKQTLRTMNMILAFDVI
jgi:hypothetical protein